MRIVIQPFMSQQSKTDGKFLIESEVTTQISRFLASMLKHAGQDVFLIVPDARDCDGGVYPDWLKSFSTFPRTFPIQNKNQRLEFDPVFMQAALNKADLFITHHELMAWKVRKLMGDKIKIIHFNHLMPLGDWEWMEPVQVLSWSAADLTVFLAYNLARFAKIRASVKGFENLNTRIWPLVYDENMIRPREVQDPADVDLLFVQRCSASNYTKHKEFISAVSILRMKYKSSARVMFTDPTGYLEQNQILESPLGVAMDELDIHYAHAKTREDYFRLLNRSKVAVAMMTKDLHGGVAIREAIATGCLPVMLDEPCYNQMLHPYESAWPYMIRQPIRTLEFATLLYDILEKQSKWLTRHDLANVQKRIQSTVLRESYQKAWDDAVWPDISSLLGITL